MNKYNITISSENDKNMLGRIAQIFSRKLVDIEHLSMHSYYDFKAFILIVNVKEIEIQHIVKLIEKQVEVINVFCEKIISK